ncbi:MAG: hypothetical protein MUF25_21775, partial [Pirellulaceae bacterium]|nr:hypothetical protein [Pirellulaceae bacterium]
DTIQNFWHLKLYFYDLAMHHGFNREAVYLSRLHGLPFGRVSIAGSFRGGFTAKALELRFGIRPAHESNWSRSAPASDSHQAIPRRSPRSGFSSTCHIRGLASSSTWCGCELGSKSCGSS